jgi:hypothetical protein
LALVALLSSASLITAPQSARANDLAGVTLTPVESTSADATGDEHATAIGDIVVLTDTDRSLTLRITLAGFAAGEIRAEAQTDDRRPIRHLPPATAAVAQAAHPSASVEVVLALASDAPAGFSAASDRLAVVATPPEGTPGPPVVREYRLVNTWKTALAPEDVVVRVTPQPIGTTGALLARLEGTGGTLPEPATGGATTCFDAVQNRIAWNYAGSTGWADSNVNDLCRAAETTREPARCFNKVMHGGVDWGGGTTWEWQPALALCAGTQNADRTVTCFQRDIARGQTQQQATERCKAAAAPPESAAATTCPDAVQGRIAWDYAGSTTWAPGTIADLCRGAEASREPAQCFNRVMHGGVDWGGSTQWGWSNALNLCTGTANAERTIGCFQGDLAGGQTWQQAIDRCKASASVSRPPIVVRPTIAMRPGAAASLRTAELPVGLATAVEAVAPPPESTPLVRAAPVLARPILAERIDHNVRLSSATSEATAKLPTFARRVELAEFNFSRVETPAEPGSTRPTNSPSNQPIDLLSGLTLAVPLSQADIMQIYDKVYLDKNEASGVFYYFPRAYNVAWDGDAGIERGLGLRIAYEQTTGGETAHAVRMAVLLDARVDLQEVQLARELLQLQSRRQGFTFRELRVFPLSAPPTVSLVDALQSRFSLRADQVAINALSSALDQIELSWVTDPITAGNIRLTLRSGFGINGAAQFLPPNQDGPAPSIPVNIRLDSTDTYGRFAFDRDGVMRNLTPFDLKLVHLHALVIENDAPAIYSWSLGNKVLPPKAKVEFDTAKLPEAVDEKARLMWVSYAIDKTCESCIQDTIDAAVIGNVWPDTTPLSLRTLTPLADTQTSKLEVRTRSRFFDPDSRTMRAGPVLIFEADGEAHTIEPVFLADRTPPEGGPDWPLFEYQVSAILPSGEVVEGRNWLPAPSERVFIGSFQLRQSTGAFGAPG